MRRIYVPLFVLAALVPQTGAGQETFSAQALVDLPRDGWRTNGGNLYNQRYSPLSQIDRENVGELRGVWQARLRGSGVGTKYSGEGQPIVHDGVIYIPTGADDVFALSVETGEILWQYEANLDQTISTVCCGWISRGVAIGDGFAIQLGAACPECYPGSLWGYVVPSSKPRT